MRRLPMPPKKKRAVATKKNVAKAPPRARITVPRRSFLDPGREVLPGSQREFTDYAFPPGLFADGRDREPGRRVSLAAAGSVRLAGPRQSWPWHYCAELLRAPLRGYSALISASRATSTQLRYSLMICL